LWVAPRDPDAPSPVPVGREAKRLSTGERGGMLAHVSVRREGIRG